VTQRLLKSDVGDLRQPRRLGGLLEVFEARGEVVVQPLATLEEGIGALLQSPVVDPARAAERTRELLFLLGRRVAAVAVGALEVHECEIKSPASVNLTDAARIVNRAAEDAPITMN
jgi:hypothetical protein